MEQLSRPFQIALIAVIGLSMVWFVALRHSSSSSTPPAATTPAPTTPAPTTASSHSSPSATASSSEAGEGYSGAIDKAHGAVTESQQNARQLENRSAQASNEAVPTHGAGASPATRNAPSSPATPKSSTSSSPTPSANHSTTIAKIHKTSADSSAVEVQREIASGDTVILMFWNPKAVDDVAVHKQLELAKRTLGHKVVVHDASAKQIGIFGQVTQDVTVYQTPTILIINRKKLVTTLTGFTDAFSIKQAVREAQK